MRVLQLHCSYRIQAGEDSVVRAEAAMLERGGHEVVRYNPENPTGARDSLSALSRSLYNRRAAREVRDLVERTKPDIAHVHNTWFAASASVHDAIASCGVPIAMTVHNYRLACISSDLFRDGEVCTACVGVGPWAGVRHRCYRDSLPLSLIAASEIAVNRRRSTVVDNVDRFVAPTAFLGDRLVEMGLPRDRIVVKPHFVADPGARTRPAAESDEVVFVGRLAAGKGIELLVEAWEAAALPGLRLVVMGDGPLRPWLEERAGPTIEVAGWCEHDAVMTRLLGARSLVFTSEWFEPFGMVLIEALGAGLPVVATDVAGVRGILDPPAHLVVPPGRADLLADALAHLGDASVVAAESARACSRFEDHFTESANLPLLEAIYADTIAHRGVR